MKTKAIQVLVLIVSLCLLAAGTAGATGYTLTLYTNGFGGVMPDNTNNPHPAGVNITITATASNGWYFSNWSGDASGTNNPLQVTMNSNLAITGNFLPFPVYSVALVTNGQGRIDLIPPGGSYLSNTVVTATATAATGWVFTVWSGITNTSANPISLTLNTNSSLTGTFAQLPAFDAQPAGVTNKLGSTVNFSAHAVGNAPLGYQWFFSGGSLSGSATNTTLALTNVSSGQSGTYWIVATNSYGSATSHLATLTLTNGIGPTNMVNSPDEASLRAAIKIGGWIGLGFNGTVTITNTIAISNNVILDGNNVTATISGGDAVRIFYIASGASLTASNLTLANGSMVIASFAGGTNADGGAIYNDGGSVALAGCTVTNCTAQALMYGGVARGGAIFNNAGTVSLYQSVITNSSVVGGGPNSYVGSATGFGLGGAIYNTNGSVTIIGCTVSGNLCKGMVEDGNYSNSGRAMGGAAFQSAGSMAICGSSFTLNQAVGGPGQNISSRTGGSAYGGAVAITGGSLSIDHSQFFINQVVGGLAGSHGAGGSSYGGAIYSTATLAVRDSSFSGNQSSAGGNTIVPTAASEGTDGFGGAIYNAGIALLDRCSVYSNSVHGGNAIGYGPFGSLANGGNALGGGILNAAQLSVSNCTIAANSTIGGGGYGPNQMGNVSGLGLGGTALGGGVFNNANATFIAMNLTIASNFCISPSGFAFTNGAAAGLQIANTNGTLRLHNSIIAYAGTNSNAYGPITDDGYNISSDGSAGFASGSSYNFTDPQLAPLGDYGGPTWCMALLPTSPAIDFGDSNGAPNTDQRVYVRPFGAGVDIGAVEYGSVPHVQLMLSISNTTTNFQLSFATTVPGSYRLQSSTNLISWIDLSTNGPFSGTTNITQSVSKQGPKARYFRLLVQ